MLTLWFEVAMEHSFLQDYKKLHSCYHIYREKQPPRDVLRKISILKSHFGMGGVLL